MTQSRSLHAALVFAVGISSAGLVAQATNELDFDTTQLPLTTIPPNGATHSISTSVTYTGQNLVLNAPLVIRSNGELRLIGSVLNVHGGVKLEEGSRLTVIDSTFLLSNAYTAEHELRNEGGLLCTERALIGSAYQGSVVYPTHFLHLRGTWVARQTVLQGLITELSYGRSGWNGDPRLKGGSIFADGLYEGDRNDAIHMSGMGDAILANGTVNIALLYDAGTSTQPVSETINLNSRLGLNLVYGDPLVHSGVTSPIATSPCRLELVNHRSVTWQFFAIGASASGPLHTLTLQNAEDIICSFRGVDLVGSPIYAGPWTNYYSALPGLPSTTPPGHHALPPGCSVRLGNVKFQSGPGANDWNSVRSWGLYAQGSGTNLSITGAAKIAEIQLQGGQMHLDGTGSYEMGLYAGTVRLYDDASLHINNAAIGNYDRLTGSAAGLIEANDGSNCSITNSRVAAMRFKTTNAAAWIWAQNLLGVENVTVDTAAGGSVQIAQATPAQNWDLQNLGFESPLSSAVPPYWSATSISGSLANDAAPGAPGTKSYELVAPTGGGVLQKQLTLSPETFVSVIGAAKTLQQPGGSGQLQLRAAQGTTTQSKALGSSINTWRRVNVPLLTVGTSTAPTVINFFAGSGPATVRLDDIRVHIGSWWDNNNLANLGFEMGYRFPGQTPGYWTAPDAWRSGLVRCAADSTVLRPGAAAGSRSMRAEIQAEVGDVYKDLTFLRPGDTVVMTGWARGVSSTGGVIRVYIGNGPTFYVATGGNQTSGALPCNGTWQSFQLTYVVPSNPSYIHIGLNMFDVPGTQFWFDDLTVEIQ